MSINYSVSSILPLTRNITCKCQEIVYFILVIYFIGCCHCTHISKSQIIPCRTYYETSCHKLLVSYSESFHLSCKIDENKIFKKCYLQTPEGTPLFLNNKTNHKQGRIVSITNTSTCGALIKKQRTPISVHGIVS